MADENLLPPLLISSLFFPSVGRSLPCSCSDSSHVSETEPPSPWLCLPSLMVIDETRRLWGSDEWRLLSVWEEERNCVHRKWRCIHRGRMTSCGCLSVMFQTRTVASFIQSASLSLGFTSGTTRHQLWAWRPVVGVSVTKDEHLLLLNLIL